MVVLVLNKLFNRDKLYCIGEITGSYTIQKILGEGRYGIAYLATNKNEEKVVIKQLKNNMIKKSKDKVKYEKEILQKLNNNAFPKFIESFEDGDKRGYILEYKEGTTFEDLIYKDRYVFTKSEILNICNKLISLIEGLEENNIVHKDIRVSNVILSKNGDISLIDFGLARFVDDEKYTKEMDFWYLGDFLLHLYYTSYTITTKKSKPWYEELDISEKEKIFIKKLMGIEREFTSLEEIKREIDILEEYI